MPVPERQNGRLGRESFVHDLYGRCIFWTELPKRPKAYFKLMGRNE